MDTRRPLAEEGAMTSAASLSQSSPTRAIAVICAGVFLLSLSDVCAKALVANYSPLQLIFVRNVIALPVVALILLALAGPPALRTPHLRVHALRGLMIVGAAWSFFSGLKTLPLAEATALVFAAPIFITLMSAVLLREPVGVRRWLAVLTGFAGVLIIVRPGAETFQPASLMVIATAVFYAAFMLSTRWIGPGERFGTMTFYVVLFPLIYAAPFALAEWRPVQPDHIPYFLGLAACATLGVTLIGQAFRMASASVVAPFDYSALLWASLWGWMIWGELPDAATYAGAAVIIASAVYIVLREARLKALP
jgi:drug/metabolite transporter (DMT)-like permease